MELTVPRQNLVPSQKAGTFPVFHPSAPSEAVALFRNTQLPVRQGGALPCLLLSGCLHLYVIPSVCLGISTVAFALEIHTWWNSRLENCFSVEVRTLVICRVTPSLRFSNSDYWEVFPSGWFGVSCTETGSLKARFNRFNAVSVTETQIGSPE